MNWLPIDPIEHERRIGEIRRMEEVFYLTADWDYLDRFFSPNITVEELLGRYDAGERNFTDICLPVGRWNLSNVDLSGAILTGAKLSNGLNTGPGLTNATGANLRGADLRYSYLGHIDFTGANLTRTNLSFANLNECDLIGACLNGAIISNADIVGAKFVDVKMKDTIGHFGRQTGAFFGKAVELADGSFEIRGEYRDGG
jgi:uncharacterized protein YjbI with pentapeptide repeats